MNTPQTTKPKTIALAALPQLTGDSRATIMRWAARGYFGRLHVPPGGERFRQVDVIEVENRLGRLFSAEEITAAVERHEAETEEKRVQRTATRRVQTAYV